MKASRRIAPLLLTAALFVGCGDDDPTEPEPEVGITIDDLVGSWIAASNTYTNNANAAETFDMIAAGGEVRFTMLAGGATRIWVEFDTFLDEWDALVSISGDILTSDPVEEGRPTEVFTFTLVDGVLTLTATDREWDFTLTGAAGVSSTLVTVYVRN